MKTKVKQEWHAPKTKFGMGDNYGTGIRAKLGRMRDDSMGMHEVPKKKLLTPPRSLA